MEKLRMESIDMVSENIKKIENLFPNCITETVDENGKPKKAINFELLRQMLSKDVLEGDEAYEFTWVGKKAAIVEANKPIRKTLRPCPDESVNWDTTENIYIEGDNLEVLKLLQESYLGKVKMIYIDPPYNTGNDFIYRDDFAMDTDEYAEQSGLFDDETGEKLFLNTDSNGRFHSDWCSMIYPRLMLARNLLSEDGVIYISIDDNEVENLRKLCDEVFGESNFISCVVVENDARVRSYDSLAITHEYLIIYRKSINYSSNILENPDKKFKYHDVQGGFDLYELRNRNSDFNVNNRPNLYYPFWVNPNKCDENELYEIALDERKGWIKFYPQESQGIKTVWRWGKEKAQQNLNKIIFGRKAIGGWQVVKKYREASYSLKSVWQGSQFLSDRGTLDFKKLFNNKRVFSFPKPIELIKQCLSLSSKDDDIVMDFFSGSASTAHAVIRKNIEDNGRRKFIMVQLPEQCDENSEAAKAGFKTICEIGKERIRRAGKKIKEENSLTTQDLDVGFRVFKLDDSNMNDVYYSANEYKQDMVSLLESNIKEERTDLDLLFGCLLEWGLPLSLPYRSEEIEGCKVHTYNENDLVACFDENVPETVVREIAKRKPLRVVFRDSSFADSPSKINVGEIFKMLAPDTRVKVI